MTSLPPHAKVSVVNNFLEEDEAESLSYALLSLIEDKPPSKVSTVSEDEITGPSGEMPNAPINLNDARRIKRTTLPAAEAVRSREAYSQIDEVQDDLRAALAKPSRVTDQFRVIEGIDDAAAMKDDDVEADDANLHEADTGEVRSRASSTKSETSSASGVVFFDRPTPIGANATPRVRFPNEEPDQRSQEVTGSTKELFNRMRQEFTLPTDETAAGKGSYSVEGGHPTDAGRGFNMGTPEIGTVAGSGFSDPSDSETIAGSGNQPVPSNGREQPPKADEPGFFSWFCSERQTDSTRAGFEGEGAALMTRAAAADHNGLYPSNASEWNMKSAALVSSDLSSVEIPHTPTLNLGELRLSNHRRRMALVSSGPELDTTDATLATALTNLEHRDHSNSAGALTAVAVLSIALFGWVAYAYINGTSEAPVNFQRALLAGPLVVRSAAFGARTTKALSKSLFASSGRRNVSLRQSKKAVVRNLSDVAKEIAPLANEDSSLGLPIRHRSWARFRLHRLDAAEKASIGSSSTCAVYVVDLPTLETNAVVSKPEGQCSAVNLMREHQEPEAVPESRLRSLAGAFVQARQNQR